MIVEAPRHGTARRLAALAAFALAAGACATWQPPVDDGDAALRARATSQSRGGVRLSAAVLGAEDSIRMLGTDVTRHDVQPVWIEVRNDTDHYLWLLRSGTDPDYFSPLEVAWFSHVKLGGSTNARIDEHFDRLSFRNPVPAGGVTTGILFTNPQPVVKLLNVDLLGDRAMIPFTMLLPVPGEISSALQLAYPYDETVLAAYDDLDALRRALEALPCCVTSADGTDAGEPLNVIVVGALDDVGAAASRRGYRRESVATGDPQRLFGRPPDFVARKVAQAGAPANWLRVWRAPISFRGQFVFVVQAGRPVGGRFAATPDGRARLHPDVDEARNLLVQDFMYSGGLETLAFVGGVGATPDDAPRRTADGDRYHTDGHRAVLFLSSRPRAFADVEILDWEAVPRGTTSALDP